MVTAAEVGPPSTTPLCRVCGDPLREQQSECRRCGTPTRGPIRYPLDSTWVDIVLATAVGITALAISLPITVWLAQPLLRGPNSWGVMEAAVAISVFNGWTLGVPVMVTTLSWRNRVRNDEHHHSIAVREYWQAQALCLIPPSLILLPIVTVYCLFTFL